MSERPRASPDRKPPAGPLTAAKTADYRYAFRGTWDREPEGVCRVRILEAENDPPIVVLTELHENESTSVTNAIELIAAELIAKHFPQRFEVIDDPIILIEHHPPVVEIGGRRRPATYDRVVFRSWVPRRVWLGGQERRSLEGPDWRHLPPDEVRDFLGDEVEHLPVGVVGDA